MLRWTLRRLRRRVRLPTPATLFGLAGLPRLAANAIVGIATVANPTVVARSEFKKWRRFISLLPGAETGFKADFNRTVRWLKLKGAARYIRIGIPIHEHYGSWRSAVPFRT
jgi:hypothetical protein